MRNLIGSRPVRAFVVEHMPLVVYLASYVVLIVMGVVGFAIFRESFAPNYPLHFLEFAETFSVGFWVLLLIPLVAVPVAYTVSRRLLLDAVREFSNRLAGTDAAIITIALVCTAAYIAYALHVSEAFGLSGAASDDVSSVHARFEILSRLSFVQKVAIQAIAPFLVYVALTAYLVSMRSVWLVIAGVTVIVATIGMVALNMKWPVVLMYIGIAISTFTYARKRPLVWSVVALLFAFVVYLAVSNFVFRMPSAPVVSPSQSVPSVPAQPENAPAQADIAPAESDNAAVSRPSAESVPPPVVARSKVEQASIFVRMALVRLAVVYPYYYSVFTTEGTVCGNMIDQARRGQKCRPSLLVYERMFPGQQFVGVGTAPISAHVSSYALGGWPIAIVCLAGIGLVLALFSAIPVESGNAFLGGLRVMGALAGYQLATIPAEGVLIYDHGLIWMFAFVTILMAAKSLVDRARH